MPTMGMSVRISAILNARKRKPENAIVATLEIYGDGGGVDWYNDQGEFIGLG